jgi:hypothetical protein
VTQATLICCALLLLVSAILGLLGICWAAGDIDGVFLAITVMQFAAMISASVSLLNRSALAWRVAFFSLMAETIVPVLGCLGLLLIAIAERQPVVAVGGRQWRGWALVALVMTLLLWLNLGPAMFLTRSRVRWAFACDALRLPTAKHSTWVVAGIWAALVAAAIATSILP